MRSISENLSLIYQKSVSRPGITLYYVKVEMKKKILQGNTPDELPECLLGTCRINHLDASKSVQVEP